MSSAQPTREELGALSRRLGLVLDTARVASDHVSTLLLATRGGVSSGPKTERNPRTSRGTVVGGVIGFLQRQAPPFSLEDQLRRARLALAELEEAMVTLDATDMLTALDLPERERSVLVGWIPPALEHAGSKASRPHLEAARQQVGELVSALTALDGRIRLAVIRLR